MSFLQKHLFCSQPPPKTLFFSFFIFFVSIFSYFSFSNIKKTKTKAHIVKKKPFDTLTNCQKIFSHPYTLFEFLKIPPKHYKIEVKQANKNLGPSFEATLDQVLTHKNPNIGSSFDSIYIYIFVCMYIYMYVYIYIVKLLIGPSLAVLSVVIWAKFVFSQFCGFKGFCTLSYNFVYFGDSYQAVLERLRFSKLGAQIVFVQMSLFWDQ